MCDSVGMDLIEFMKKNKTRTLDRNEPTSIYLLTCGKWAKIGIASDVSRRVSIIQSNCPMLISVDMQKEFQSRLYAIMAEAEAHKILADYRIHNEWFSVRAAIARRVVSAVSAATDALAREHTKKSAANDNMASAAALEIATCTPDVQVDLRQP